jgi:hypothetical protein
VIARFEADLADVVARSNPAVLDPVVV